ncbi:MAG: iron-sulfur cluster-binding domain-containing protein [Firmicutes bacterium]|nr:iron-sulfur cluster-binding domain-containing protein [Bacillota bacterium]
MNNIEFLRQERKDIIKDYPSKEIPNTIVDDLVKSINEIQYVIVKEIIEETKDTKSFILIPDKSKGTNTLEPFKAGQYISIKMFIGDTYVTRAYSLSSSPKDAINGIYRITIKRVEKGLVSNALLDDMKVGDGLAISKPTGIFTYNKIRDEENVIAIAGGCGITPFMSLAKSIIDGIEDCYLTVFYSVKTENDIIFKKDIELINKKSKKVKFIITLTREDKNDYLNGHITKDMIEPYLKDFNTIFMCGPKELYKSMNEILNELNIPRKSVHYENFYTEYTPLEINTYELKILMKNKTEVITCKSNETLLVSLEKAGIKAPSLCRVGTCGFCRSILIDGKIKTVGESKPKALTINDYIHPCVTYPESDIVIRIDI